MEHGHRDGAGRAVESGGAGTETPPSPVPEAGEGSSADGAARVTEAAAPGSSEASGASDPSDPPRPASWRTRGRRWRAVVFAPVGDGQTRRRGSDAVKLGLAAAALVVCWLGTKTDSNLEHTVATTMGSPPDGVRWLISSIWWITSLGVVCVIAFMTLVSRRLSAIRDIAVSGATAWLLCILSAVLLGTDGGRPQTSAYAHVDLAFPVARVAATVAVVTAALPYFSRWLQLCLESAIGLLAITAVVNGSGVPLAVLASLAVGWGVTRRGAPGVRIAARASVHR